MKFSEQFQNIADTLVALENTDSAHQKRILQKQIQPMLEELGSGKKMYERINRQMGPEPTQINWERKRVSYPDLSKFNTVDTTLDYVAQEGEGQVRKHVEVEDVAAAVGDDDEVYSAGI